MKKVLTVGAVLLLATAALFAAAPKTEGATEKNMFGMGANLGTDLGFYVNYGYGIFDIDGIFGADFVNDRGATNLDIEVGLNFALFDIAKACDFPGAMPITVGVAAGLLINFNGDLGLKVQAPIKLAYTFEDVPVSLFLRLSLGMGVYDWVTKVRFGFAWDLSVGATYNFNF